MVIRSYSLEGLARVLFALADMGFQLMGVQDFLHATASASSRRSLVLRHDVDADIRAAAKFAEWEKQLGLRSTYLVMLQSPLYNVFSRSGCRSVEAIASCGHEIGLHFDWNFNDSAAADLSDVIDSQAQIISDFFSVPVSTFSAHQPNARALETDSYKGRLTSCYTDPSMMRLAYFSDSNRERELRDVVEMAAALTVQPLEDTPGIQFLTHPMWWIYDDKDPADVWDRVLLSNMVDAQEQLAQTERAFGSPRRVHLSKVSQDGLEGT